MSDTRFSIDYSKRLSKCKKCKTELGKGKLRLAKQVANAFDSNNDSDMKLYYHIECLFDTFKRVRANSKKIESPDDIEGFSKIQKSDQQSIIDLINLKSDKDSTKNSKNVKEFQKSMNYSETDNNLEKKLEKKISKIISDSDSKTNSDDKFEVFQTICNKIARHSSHLEKTKILKDFFDKGMLIDFKNFY